MTTDRDSDYEPENNEERVERRQIRAAATDFARRVDDRISARLGSPSTPAPAFRPVQVETVTIAPAPIVAAPPVAQVPATGTPQSTTIEVDFVESGLPIIYNVVATPA